MTIATEPTTTPEVPAWLNLDAIVPPDTREGIASALDYVKTNLDTIRMAATGVRTWVRYFEELGRDVPDEVFTFVLTLTGVTELEQLALDVAHIFQNAADASELDEESLERLDAITEAHGEAVEEVRL